jgi:putative hydrolase of the HAD superfamily
MNIKGIIFDINGTLVDILTDEGNEEIYRGLSHFLTFQGMHIHRKELRDEYFSIMAEQRRASAEAFPEFDTVLLWREFLERRPQACAALPKAKLRLLPLVLSEMYRGVSRYRLQLFPKVGNILDDLARRYKLAIVSDAQSAWAEPELRAVGIHHHFKPIVISGDFGFRKPDRRLFQAALDGLGLGPEAVLFVGDDMYRDVYGARQMGLKTVYFASRQGDKAVEGVRPDYIIHQFAELPAAIAFFEAQ